MNWKVSVPVALAILFGPAALLTLHGQATSPSTQPPAPAATAEASPSNLQTAQEQKRQTLHGHYRSCDQALDEARNRAHALADKSDDPYFAGDSLRAEHKKLQEQIEALLKTRQSLIEAMSPEQRSLIQERNASMQEMHESVQRRLQAMDQEFTGNVLHMTTVLKEARATERDIKTYQKHLQKAGATLDLLRD